MASVAALAATAAAGSKAGGEVVSACWSTPESGTLWVVGAIGLGAAEAVETAGATRPADASARAATIRTEFMGVPLSVTDGSGVMDDPE